MHRLAAVTALVFALGSTSAYSAIVTNEDSVAHKIVVEESGARREITLQPAQTVRDTCKTTCAIWLGDAEDGYDLFKADKVTISKGEFLFEETEVGQAQPKQ